MSSGGAYPAHDLGGPPYRGGGKRPQSHPSSAGPSRQPRRGRDYISPCLKYCLFFFNFAFWLIGATIAGLGMWLIIDKDKEVRDALDIVFDPSILLCAAGVVTFIIAFFGCLGALRENICLLRTFWVILLILLIVEILMGVCIFIFYYVPSVREKVDFLSLEKLPLKKAVERYRDDDDLRSLIDSIQQEFECCGVSNDDTGYKDWQANVYFNCSDDNPSIERCGVPYSCCVKTSGEELINVMCGFQTTDKSQTEAGEKIHTRGCLKGFGSWIDQNIIIIGAVCLGIVIPELIGVHLGRTLIGQIEDQKAQWQFQR